jgi:predicted metallopeptidase
MKYVFAEDLQKRAEDIVRLLFPYIRMDRVKCYRSWGTSSRGTLARCHGMGKIFQKALNIDAVYVLEFLSERFDKLDQEEQTKIILHELMHIPKTFGGGFKHHDFVHERNVNKFYKEYLRRKQNEDKSQWRVL